jgi:dynactin-5
LSPPGRISKGVYQYTPLKLSDHVFVGPNTVVEAAVIGSRVHIGADCVIGKFAVIKDCVRVLDGTVVPQGMVVPSWSVVAGRPGRVVAELREGEEEGLEGREAYRNVGN